MVTPRDLVILSQAPGIGSVRMRSLVNHFGSMAALRKATAREIARVEGLTQGAAVALARFFRSAACAAAERFADAQGARLAASGGRILSFWDPAYPDALRMIYDPPPFLHMLGDLCPDDAVAIALVGTRKPSAYGKQEAARFASALAGMGMSIVSGLARGIDTVVHEAALSSGGRTLAVIGSGIDIIYPWENKALARRIAGAGAVLSEYPMGARPEAANFPRRNRVISGLALGTVVLESDLTGGAMITTSMALEQNREVFALPGPVSSPESRGCHQLIKGGRAKLVEGVEDVLIELAGLLRGRTAAGSGSTSSSHARP